MSDKVEEMHPDEEQYCDKTGCVQNRRERDALLASIRDLTHSQLISRDIELGLRAELMQTQIDIEDARARGNHDLAETRRSVTWRVGRLVLRPVSLGKRVFRLIKK
ncbi:hypothetical protein SAMN05216368_11197 [Cryobacterium flavum]|uniref:Uncharacterized protein n=1 Tax=Cryobacterium flavum TaxID=1424659 RepID=A0A4R8UZQ4_9MICO|nr:hypothetical protein [Cryobacterium flavum]TFB74218.1 hypothetical protein E3O21_15620 [Cryobacterium flavum]SDO16304.1 hypothetical protein SAMN05216368_11197 [Cryobacterium flavum]